jgi:peptidoglycan/LPS O-acetylase OafA/YrhL
VTTTLTAPKSPVNQPDSAVRKRFRPDIEGLRAVSIVGVVLFHAKVPHFTGGFVGVDVFFVISGFLITGQLVREAERRGRIRMGAFFARRAKRLLPAAALVIAVTAVVALFAAPLLRVFTACFDLLWSMFYIGNWRFIKQGNDYLAGNSDYNVALHFWSLAVEEQFYLVWPLLLLLSICIARRRDYPVRYVVCGVMAAVSLVSFAAGVWLTHANPSLAYMATYTRAWQFGVGALLAVAAPTGLRFRFSWVLGWIGLLAIIYAVVEFAGTTPYPGWAALVPTLGAVAVIGAPSLSLDRALAHPVMRLIGRWSYSWYLWHWPVLVLAEAKFGHLSWQVKLALMGGTLILAGLTYLFVEKPIMGSRDLGDRATAAAAIGIIATVSTVVLQVGTRVVNALGSANGYSTTSVSFDEVFGRNSGKNSGPVVPPPMSARHDYPRRADCLLDRTTVEPPDCDFGVKGGEKVVLFGDSHAHQWQTALDMMSMSRKWELKVITQSGCPAPTIARRNGDTSRFSQDYCVNWRAQQIDNIVAMHPKLVIFSSSNRYIPFIDELIDSWNTTLSRLEASGAKLVYLRDTPHPPQSIPDCVSSAIEDWSRCAFPLPTKVDPVVAGQLRGALPPLTVIDLNGYFCDGNVCPAVRNGIMLYRDESHLSNTAVKALAPAVDRAFADKGL